MTNSSLPSLQKHTLSDPASRTMVTWIVWRELSDDGNSTYKASIHDDSLDLLLVGFLGQDLELTHDMLLFNDEWAPENICGLARAGEPEAEAEHAQNVLWMSLTMTWICGESRLPVANRFQRSWCCPVR
ncbi:hypothetical protein IFT80_04305 [Pseudomonas sp. CFBP 8771]|uniref:hypothetical protein n=1 Tax=Pseudomonas sp. CFBP 8771 TaxID=2775285 RepID=UPI00177D32F0|nr:hypothetical protein [Pseudomonas sp. CFBP 8771]MBD8601863.1 hypothetical protein [Pseudomonas sp. CFBP 8771]